MKTGRLLRLLSGLTIVTMTGMAQDIFHSDSMTGHELLITNLIFSATPGERMLIPLKDHGLKKHNYSVLVKVRVLNDPVFYTIPGQLPSGDSLGFLMKAGGKQSDTLMIIRRSGDRPLVLEEVKIAAFHSLRKRGILNYDAAFTQFLLARYLRLPPPQ